MAFVGKSRVECLTLVITMSLPISPEASGRCGAARACIRR